MNEYFEDRTDGMCIAYGRVAVAKRVNDQNNSAMCHISGDHRAAITMICLQVR